MPDKLPPHLAGLVLLRGPRELREIAREYERSQAEARALLEPLKAAMRKSDRTLASMTADTSKILLDGLTLIAAEHERLRRLARVSLEGSALGLGVELVEWEGPGRRG
jgi:hypothetical protein